MCFLVLGNCSIYCRLSTNPSHCRCAAFEPLAAIQMDQQLIITELLMVKLWIIMLKLK